MRLNVRLDGRSTRRWHIDLLDRLRQRPGIDLSVDVSPGNTCSIPGLSLLFRTEAHLHGIGSGGLASAASIPDLGALGSPTGPIDLIVDLCGDVSTNGIRVWRLTYGGVAGEPALLRQLMAGSAPTAELHEGNVLVAAGRLGTESGGIVLAAFEDCLARVTTLILAALSGGAKTVTALPSDMGAASEPVPARATTLAAKGLARGLVKRVYRALYNAPHWRTGWRHVSGPDLFDLRRHPEGGWHDIPDDGTRFYADPFPIEHEGRVTLFVEDFEHAVGKGVISAVDFGPDGPIGSPVAVLEQPTHLSYPFVFAHDGQMWMVPESSGAGRVDLFRATAFPRGWIREATLLSDVAASDATLVQHEGVWWLFATVRDRGGAFSDALHLWFAPSLTGPWTAHRHNPVLIDIASARPAGRVVQRGGALLRPVQDCRSGYGAALGIARITRLDPDGFEQTMETILTPGPRWTGRRLHTLNSAGGFEFIDGSALAPRWGRRRS